MKSIFDHYQQTTNNTEFSTTYVFRAITGLQSENLDEQYINTNILISLIAIRYYIDIDPEFFVQGHIKSCHFNYCILKACKEENLPEEFSVSAFLTFNLAMSSGLKIKKFVENYCELVKRLYSDYLNIYLPLNVEQSPETKRLIEECEKFIDCVTVKLKIS